MLCVCLADLPLSRVLCTQPAANLEASFWEDAAVPCTAVTARPQGETAAVFFLFSVFTLGMFPRPRTGGACALQPSSNPGPQVLEVLMLFVSEELV